MADDPALQDDPRIAGITVRAAGTKPSDDPFAAHFGDKPPEQAAPVAPTDAANYDHAFSDKPPEAPSQPAREVGNAESAVKGIGNALTFGASPAIAGLAEASGMPSAAEGHPDGIDLNPVRPIVGAARLLHNYLSEHPDPEVQAAYERGRQAQLSDEQLAQEQHPAAYIAGQLGGALLTPLGIAGAGVKAAKAANAGGNVVRAVGAGAVGGGLYGAGGAIGEGKTASEIPLEAAKGAATGAALGGVFGAGAEAGGKVGSKIASMVRGKYDPEAEASRLVAQKMADDYAAKGGKIDSQASAAGQAAGTPVSIIDAGGEGTKALGEWAATTSARGREVLKGLIEPRFEQQAERISGAIRKLGGGAHAAHDQDLLKTMARAANKPAYQAAYNRGARGIWHPKLEQLLKSPDVQKAARDATGAGANKAVAQGFTPVKNPFTFGKDGSVKLTDPNVRPNLQFWDVVKQNLDDKIEKLKRKGAFTGDLVELKNQLVAHLDNAVPEYKAARQGASAFFGAENASEAGQKFVIDNFNEYGAKKALAAMNGPERELFARAFASELADKIAKTSFSGNVLKSAFLNNGPARDKIRLALGPQRADFLEALLRIEKIVDEPREILVGSPTARRIGEMVAGASAVGTLESIKEHDLNPMTFIHAVIAGALIGGVHHGAKIIDERTAHSVAKLLVSNDPNALAKGIKIIIGRPKVFAALREATSGSARVAAHDIGPENAMAGAATLAQRAIRGPDPEHPDHTPENPYDLPMQ